MDLLLICLIPLGLSLLFATAPGRALPGLWLLAVLAHGASAAWLLSYLPTVSHAAYLVPLPWVPDLGLSLSLYLDGLSLLFALLITGIGSAVLLYTRAYFADDAVFRRFTLWLLAFASAMLFLVLAGNLITLFIAWELTSLTSFMLIGFEGHRHAAARQGALTALVVTGLGGLALLVGLVMLALAVSPTDFRGFELAVVLDAGSLAHHPWAAAMVILLLLAAFTKSAQAPFHFWLPASMTAPSPASAFLHSATMVKAGVYLVARLSPTFGEAPLWSVSLVTVGLTTLLVGAVMAVQQRDLKAILAYTTVSYLGLMMALLGLPDGLGVKAALVVLLAHALYKAPLFLMAGVVEHATHHRQLDHLGGLAKKLPLSATIVGLAAVSMMGIWPWLGFVAKEIALVALMTTPWLLAVLLVSAVLTTVAALLVWVRVFFGPPPTPTAHDSLHPPGALLLAGPLLLVLVGTGLGIFANSAALALTAPAMGAVADVAPSYLLPADFLTSAAFAWSVAAVLLGIVAFSGRDWLQRTVPLGGVFRGMPTGMTCYQGAVGAVEAFADRLLRLQSGRVRDYLSVILAVFVVMMLATDVIGSGIEPFVLTLGSSADALGVLLVLLAIGGAVASVIVSNHLTATLALGVTGYAVGGLILLEPGPDVALVQFLVETLGTVLMILMMARINTDYRQAAGRDNWKQSLPSLLGSAVLAAAMALIVTLFALAAVTSREDRVERTIAHWHLSNAYPLTGVTDVVAAILADFRALDTFLEIAVFAMAALGVVTLLSLTLPPHERHDGAQHPLTAVPPKAPSGDKAPEPTDWPRVEMPTFSLPTGGDSRLSNPLTRGVAVLVLPFALLIAITQVLYGGNGPGDGFAAGVIAGLGVTLWYVVLGYDAARQRLQWLRAGTWLTAGLVLAAANALAPLLMGREFFAITKITSITAPAGLHLASTLVFELAIFCTVFGGVSLMMEAIAHPEALRGERLAADAPPATGLFRRWINRRQT